MHFSPTLAAASMAQELTRLLEKKDEGEVDTFGQGGAWLTFAAFLFCLVFRQATVISELFGGFAGNSG